MNELFDDVHPFREPIGDGRVSALSWLVSTRTHAFLRFIALSAPDKSNPILPSDANH